MEKAEAIKVIKKQTSGKKALIPTINEHETRVLLHTDPGIHSNPFSSFLDFVRGLLPPDKYNTFASLLKTPVPTYDLTSQIFSFLYKIFDGRNPYFSLSFGNQTEEQDAAEYLKGFFDRWKTEGWETMKTAINSIVVVDMPAEPTAEPEPYFYYLSVKSVLDFDTDKEGNLIWLMFKQPGEKTALFCDEYYRVYKDGKLEAETAHNLGFCPARWLWSTPLTHRTPEVKKSPLTGILSKLDMLLFFSISNEHLNLYARYPIYSSFAQDCDFEDVETGHYCEGGFLKTQAGQYLMQAGKPSECPVCSKNKLVGPGSTIEVEPPTLDNPTDLRNPVSVLTIDRTSLDYNNEDISRREKEILLSAAGYAGESINNKAVNEKQVKGIFESLETKLLEPQKNFETIIKWTIKTICLLRYKTFKDVHFSLGTEHYIFTKSELFQMYETAKKLGFSADILNILEDRYINTEYRNNPEKLRRAKIISNIDPFRHKTPEAVTEMYKSGDIKYNDYLTKVNLSSFIMRFERENTKIEQFGLKRDFNARINEIKEAFNKYVEEMKPEPEPEPEPEILNNLN